MCMLAEQATQLCRFGSTAYSAIFVHCRRNFLCAGQAYDMHVQVNCIFKTIHDSSSPLWSVGVDDLISSIARAFAVVDASERRAV